MTGWDDLLYEMRVAKIDEDTIDRLIAGHIAPDDAPPGYSDTAWILQTAASPPDREEIAMETQHVTAARAAIAVRTPAVGARDATRVQHRRLVTGLIVAGALVAIPGLAAANALPDPAQQAVSKVLDKVGISVPVSADHPATTGGAISSIATTTSSTGVSKGAEISSVASGGKSQAGQHGGEAASSSASQTSVPTVGGTGTADTASNSKSTNGTTTANEMSGGRSAEGSGNAQAAPGSKPTSVPSVAGAP